MTDSCPCVINDKDELLWIHVGCIKHNQHHGELAEAAKVASQFLAKLSADGNVFASRALRRLERAIESQGQSTEGQR